MKIYHSDTETINCQNATTNTIAYTLGNGFITINMVRNVNYSALENRPLPVFGPIQEKFDDWIKSFAMPSTHGSTWSEKWNNLKFVKDTRKNVEYINVLFHVRILTTHDLKDMRQFIAGAVGSIQIECVYGMVNVVSKFMLSFIDGERVVVFQEANIRSDGVESMSPVIVYSNDLFNRIVGVIEEISQGHLTDNV